MEQLAKKIEKMSLESKISVDLKEAMKAKDQARVRTIRAIKAALLVRKTDGSGVEINAQEEIKILQKLVKSRKESLGIYEEQGRDDLAKVEEEEIAVLEEYLPAPLSEQELNDLVNRIIKELDASGMKDMGKVMSAVNTEAAGRADGKTVATLVRSLLTQ